MIKSLAFILSASLAACSGQAEVRYAGGATAPELVAMDTDSSVMVVANSEEPIFFTENTYWLFRDDNWYRSSSHRGGWARAETPPDHVRRIDRPQAYVHYRHSPDTPLTTFNQREQVAPQPRRPDRDPSPQPQETPPYPNPLPPQQVPPTLPQPNQVPAANPDRREGPDRQIIPDPDRAPMSPGMQDRARDQRPADDRDDRRDGRRDPDQDKRRPDDKN